MVENTFKAGAATADQLEVGHDVLDRADMVEACVEAFNKEYLWV
jgi:hypothetical protein